MWLLWILCHCTWAPWAGLAAHVKKTQPHLLLYHGTTHAYGELGFRRRHSPSPVDPPGTPTSPSSYGRRPPPAPSAPSHPIQCLLHLCLVVAVLFGGLPN